MNLFSLLFFPFPPRRSSQSNLRPSIQGPAWGREKRWKEEISQKKERGKKFHLFHLLFFCPPSLPFRTKESSREEEASKVRKIPPPLFPSFFLPRQCMAGLSDWRTKKGKKYKSVIGTFSLQKFLAFFFAGKGERCFPKKLFVCFFFFSLSLPLLH